MNSLLIAMFSLFIAFIALTGCLGLGYLLANRYSVVNRLAMALLTVYVFTAVLSLRVWWDSPWLPWLIWVAMTFGVLSLLTRIRELNFRNGFKSSGGSPWFVFLCIFLVVIIFIDSLWAALPLYRYDQWTYHLLIAKRVDLLGTLRLPLTYDPIFFTGTYEYWGLLARSIWSHDAFQQGFQNSFSLLIAGVMPGLIFLESKSKGLWRWVLAFAFMTIVLFGSGDHEALANSKPDYVLMVTAMILFVSLVDQNPSSKLRPQIAGALIVAGLSYKLTWIHFGISVTPFYLFLYGARHDKRDLGKFFVGGLMALTLLVSYLVKNYQFFGNPVHPVQTALWPSKVWGAEMQRYWESVSEKPVGFLQLISNIPIIIGGIFGRLKVILLTLIVLVLFRFWHERRFAIAQWSLNAVCGVGVFLTYIAAWGLFYGPNIFNRFVSALFAMALVVLLITIRKIVPSAIVGLILLIPFFENGQIEVSIGRILTASSRSVEEFHDLFTTSPSGNNRILRQIADDRKVNFPGTAFDRAALLSDYAFTFYGPSVSYGATDPIMMWALANEHIDAEAGCASDFFKNHDIRYVWLYDKERMPLWPPAIRRLLPKLTPVPTDKGQLWRVPEFNLLSCQ